MASKAYLPGSLTLLDDWLKRDRFVFIGWSGLLLFPTAYLSAANRFWSQVFGVAFSNKRWIYFCQRPLVTYPSQPILRNLSFATYPSQPILRELSG